MAIPLMPEEYSRMPEPMKMEGLSFAYVEAIAARAGMNTYTPRRDLGVDLFLSKVEEREDGRCAEMLGAMVPFQIKSSTRWEVREDFIVYDLEAKT